MEKWKKKLDDKSIETTCCKNKTRLVLVMVMLIKYANHSILLAQQMDKWCFFSCGVNNFTSFGLNHTFLMLRHIFLLNKIVNCANVLLLIKAKPHN